MEEMIAVLLVFSLFVGGSAGLETGTSVNGIERFDA